MIVIYKRYAYERVFEFEAKLANNADFPSELRTFNKKNFL
jgi:hypothetical protein